MINRLGPTDAELWQERYSELEAKPQFAASDGSAATCEWETVSPAKICGEPAAYKDTSGKHYCEQHGNYLAKRYPTTMVKIEVPPNGGS